MKLFPLVRGHINLSTTKGKLFRHLKETCDEEITMLSYGNFSGQSHDYGLELYDDSFMVWEIPGSQSNWIYTTINCSVTDTSDGLQLNYNIRFNLWTNFLMLFIVGAWGYYFFTCIHENKDIDLNTTLMGIGVILLFLWVFNSAARSNLKFITKLEKTFANTSHEK